MNLPAIQAALREQEIDAWLFYDHHRRDPIAYNVLGLSPELHVSRRWYYLIPAQGEPAKLNHRVEPRHLQSLPGQQRHYGAWQEMWEQLREMLRPYKRVAMQYSPKNQIMYVSLVDGGTAGTGSRLRRRGGLFGRPGGPLRSHAVARANCHSF